MGVFQLRKQHVDDYAALISSFIEIRDERVSERSWQEIFTGLLWPDLLIQLNPDGSNYHRSDTQILQLGASLVFSRTRRLN